MSNDKNNLVYREQLDDNVIEMLSKDIGSNYSLRTENTKTIVAALNEILGKDIICNAVGSPLLTTDTFNVMGEKIKGLTADFKSKLLGLGVDVSGVDKMESLIRKMDEIDLGVDADTILQSYIDNLKQILSDNGIELNGDEELADLIIKVDDVLIDKDNMIKDLEYTNTSNEEISNDLFTLLTLAGFNVTDNNNMGDIYKFLEESCSSPVNVKQVACGQEHTMIVKNDGSLWGCGTSGRYIGLGDDKERLMFTKVTTNINNDVERVICGYSHTFIIKNDGSLWACGNNGSGQLGLGNTTTYKTFTQVTTNVSDVKEIVCGYNCTFMLKNDGSLWACGDNQKGHLGLNDTTNRNVFTQVTTNINNDVKQVSCSLCNHIMIVKNDGSLWGCGSNERYQLGLGGDSDKKIFTQVTNGVNNDVKEVYCTGGIYVTASNQYNGSTFIVKNDGSLWAVGYTLNGQLGVNYDGAYAYIKALTEVTDNININEVCQIAGGQYSSLLLKNDGTLWAAGGGWCRGTEDAATLIFIQVGDNVKQVSCGYNHTFIIKNDGSLWGCGENEDGQLGLNNTIDTKLFSRLKGFYVR